MKKTLLIIALIFVVIIAFYVINIYEDPAEIQAKMSEIRIALIQKNQDLADIEAYLSAREKGVDEGEELERLQNKIILASEGLVMATKDDLVSFDTEARVLRTIVNAEIRESHGELEYYKSKNGRAE